MKNERTEHICTNCKYFQRYYIIGCDCTFRPTALGSCSHLKINNKIAAKHVRRNEGCDLWQPHELQKLRQQYCIELMLQDIDKRLEDILAVLRDAE